MISIMCHGQIKKHKCIEVIEFDPIHLSEIIPQEDQVEAYDNLPDRFADIANIDGLSATIVNEEGHIVSVCGVIPNGDDGLSWAIHSELFKYHYIEVTRAVRDFFSELSDTGQFTRFIGSVEHGFEGGHRWMKLLKFTRNDELMAKYDDSSVIYERLVLWEQ